MRGVPAGFLPLVAAMLDALTLQRHSCSHTLQKCCTAGAFDLCLGRDLCAGMVKHRSMLQEAQWGRALR
jgi:hypothetical protein